MSSAQPRDTKVAILDAARELFEAKGYHAVGLDTVAKKAGVSRQAIYLHFDSKASVLSELHLRVNQLHVEPAMRKVWNSPDALAALDAFVDATATVVPQIIGMFNTLDSVRSVEEVVDKTWRPPQRGRYADCLRMAKWLDRDGELADGVTVRTAADVLFSIVSVRVYESFVMVRGWSVRRWTVWTRGQLRSMLLAPARR
jgi:AcrR family transcriptional regulator